MANPGDEFIPKPLPAKDTTDYFKILVDNCIIAFRITNNDKDALDANGVIGKERVMILEDEAYQRETKIIRAKRRIDEISEINRLRRSAEFSEEPDDTEETATGEFDIRTGERKAGDRKPKKLFDKGLLDTQLKIFQIQRDIMSEKSVEEEKEGDAINIFFIPVTREEFEKIGTVEVSTGTSEGKDAFKDDENEKAKALTAEAKADAEKIIDYGTNGSYVEKDGERVLVIE